MYKEIKYLGPIKMINAVRDAHQFILIDTDFSTKFQIAPHHIGMCIAGIMGVYESRRAPVTANVARHYIFMHEKYKKHGYNLKLDIEAEKQSLLKYSPQFEKYYHCLHRQIRQQSFGKYRAPIV
jgi:hypothetical protein